MPLPTPNDVHVDAALTNVSVAFIQNQAAFIAGRVFPSVPVMHKTDKYFLWDRNNFFRDEMQRRAPSTESAGGGMELSTDSYSCDVWALHKDIDDQVRANADEAVNIEDATTQYLTQQGLIRRDRQFTTDYFGTGVWTNEDTGGTDFTKWDDPASDPEKNVKDGLRTVQSSTGFRPNKMVVNRTVHDDLTRHPLIKDRFKYTSSESITAAMLSRFFEVDDYIVAEASYATNDEGGTDAYSFVFGKHCLLCYAPPAPSLMTPSAGYIFNWRGYTGLNDLGVRMKNFRIEKIESDRLEIGMSFDMKKVSGDLGYFFLNAVN